MQETGTALMLTAPLLRCVTQAMASSNGSVMWPELGP